MLYIHYILPDGEGLKEREWEVGQAQPSKQLEDGDLQIHTISAEGKELAHIISTFSNLPYKYTQDNLCVWRGDLARFIFDNL